MAALACGDARPEPGVVRAAGVGGGGPVSAAHRRDAAALGRRPGGAALRRGRLARHARRLAGEPQCAGRRGLRRPGAAGARPLAPRWLAMGRRRGAGGTARGPAVEGGGRLGRRLPARLRAVHRAGAVAAAAPLPAALPAGRGRVVCGLQGARAWVGAVVGVHRPWPGSAALRMAGAAARAAAAVRAVGAAPLRARAPPVQGGVLVALGMGARLPVRRGRADGAAGRAGSGRAFLGAWHGAVAAAGVCDVPPRPPADVRRHRGDGPVGAVAGGPCRRCGLGADGPRVAGARNGLRRGGDRRPTGAGAGAVRGRLDGDEGGRRLAGAAARDDAAR